MTVKKVGQWPQAAQILRTLPAKSDAALKVAVRREAELFRQEVVQGIAKGEPGGERFKPLSKTTLAIRKFKKFRGKKPLIRHGDLRRSIKSVESPRGVFVGVLRSTRNSTGDQMVNVAAVQEFGATITMTITVKQRRFLAMVFRQAGLPRPTSSAKTVLVIKIPPRPFMQPVADKLRPGAANRVANTMSVMLGKVAS